VLGDQRNVGVQFSRAKPAAGDLLDLNGDPDARRLACFKFADMTLAPQPQARREGFLREAKVFSEGSNVHPQRFAHDELMRKGSIRALRDDRKASWSHTANMAKKSKSPDHYRTLREKSGWYAAAWRDFRGLSQQEIADEVETSKGMVSDLETAANRRYNKDWLEKWCAALNVAAGDLIDTNPFVEEPRFAAMRRAFPGLGAKDVEALTDMAAALEKRGA
jgi:transcriptional regulator with XRE-family HTH domain